MWWSNEKQKPEVFWLDSGNDKFGHSFSNEVIRINENFSKKGKFNEEIIRFQNIFEHLTINQKE